jgi:hypothetical protein
MAAGLSEILLTPASSGLDRPNAASPCTPLDLDVILPLIDLPKSVRQQIGETYKRFPACGSASQTSIETRIEDQRLSCRIANCPKIPHRMVAQERVRKVPNFARKGELPDKGMWNVVVVGNWGQLLQSSYTLHQNAAVRIPNIANWPPIRRIR